MKEAIIYGGAFNPPTKAHQAVLQACVEIAELSDAEVWLMPSGDRKDKVILTDHQQRIKLARALCDSVVGNDTDIKIETTELLSNVPTETYETNQMLKYKYPEYTFRWVFGADSVQSMPAWKNGEWLMRNLGMLIVPRPGVTTPVLPTNATLLEVDVPCISSTIVRAKIAGNEPIEEYVPAEVCSVLEYAQI